MASVLEPCEPANGRRMIVAGGGTGGHLFPGIAVAQVFRARHPRNHVLFVNAGRPLETDVLTRLGWPFETIRIEGLKGRGIWNQIRALFKLPWAIWRSRQIITTYSPDVVLGVGGYSAGPVVLAAWLSGIPTVLHEQNQLAGMTNRMLRRIVRRVYLSFADRSGRFAADKTILTGNPVRDEILKLGAHAESPDKPEAFTVLILGGSQGAHAINQAMVEALPHISGAPGLRVVHQTGREDESYVSQAFAKAGTPAVVQAFFNDMAERYRQADVIVCRAGATTVAEITTVGRAAIFVPFPHAADDHQTSNAQALVEAGAAQMIRQADLNGTLLAEAIMALMHDREKRSAMAAKALTLGHPDAAQAIVRDIYQLLETNPDGQPG